MLLHLPFQLEEYPGLHCSGEVASTRPHAAHTLHKLPQLLLLLLLLRTSPTIAHIQASQAVRQAATVLLWKENIAAFTFIQQVVCLEIRRERVRKRESGRGKRG